MITPPHWPGANYVETSNAGCGWRSNPGVAERLQPAQLALSAWSAAAVHRQHNLRLLPGPLAFGWKGP